MRFSRTSWHPEPPRPRKEKKSMMALCPGDEVRHLKTGGVYLVLFPCFIEKTMVRAWAYRSAGDVVWVRPETEMLDGRFEHVGGRYASERARPVAAGVDSRPAVAHALEAADRARRTLSGKE